MFLAIRMALYLLFGTLAGQGVEFYDPETQTITISIDDLAMLLSGLGGYAGTFLSSRWAKAKGFLT